MTLAGVELRPISAGAHTASGHSNGLGAATMLTVYIVLLVAIPSGATISGLGGLGRPSVLWGLLLLFWWVLARLQARAQDTPAIAQPVRYVFGAFVIIVLLSFAAAMLRGQPADQISPATTALLRLASWSGVLMIAMDGIRTYADTARLVRALTVAGGTMAALGLAQFLTGLSFIDWFSLIPGISADAGDVATRGAFTRASGTAVHPLEYGVVLVAALPLAITTAVNRGFRSRPSVNAWLWWIPVAFILTASLVTVSRSAIIGLAVAVIASLPAIPVAHRWLVGVLGGVAAAAVFALVPGMFGTLVALFVGASDDPSTQSRTAALARVPEFIASSPFIGQGSGTFLPRYYIFDNGWVLVTVELGILGVALLLGTAFTAIGTALWAGQHSPFADLRAMGRALAASLLTILVLFAFFDGFSFSMSAGLFFLTIGLTAAVRTVAASDRPHPLAADATARSGVMAHTSPAKGAAAPAEVASTVGPASRTRSI